MAIQATFTSGEIINPNMNVICPRRHFAIKCSRSIFHLSNNKKNIGFRYVKNLDSEMKRWSSDNIFDLHTASFSNPIIFQGKLNLKTWQDMPQLGNMIPCVDKMTPDVLIPGVQWTCPIPSERASPDRNGMDSTTEGGNNSICIKISWLILSPVRKWFWIEHCIHLHKNIGTRLRRRSIGNLFGLSTISFLKSN